MKYFKPVSSFSCSNCKEVISATENSYLDKKVCQICGEIETVPAAFEDYHVYKSLGSERYSEKYLAYNTSAKRPVTLKLVNKDVEQVVVDAFLSNHRKLATVNHPNVSVIHRVDTFEGVHYVEEELLQGTLREIIYSTQSVNEIEALAMLRDITSALSVVFSQTELNHLNINPKNIRFDGRGVPKVCDFCHHRIKESDRRLIGVPKYVSPEAILYATSSHDAPPPGVQADIFSLGVTLYRLLSKKSPYTGDPMTMIKSRFTDKPKPLASWVKVDKATQRIVERMMAVKLKRRFDSMLEVFEILNEQIARLREIGVQETTEVADLMSNRSSEATGFYNEESGPQAINQQVLSKAVEDLFQLGALEYAAPADETSRLRTVSASLDASSVTGLESDDGTQGREAGEAKEAKEVSEVAEDTEDADSVIILEETSKIEVPGEPPLEQTSDTSRQSHQFDEVATESASASSDQSVASSMSDDSPASSIAIVAESAARIPPQARPQRQQHQVGRSRRARARSSSAAMLYLKSIAAVLLLLLCAGGAYLLLEHRQRSNQRLYLDGSQPTLAGPISVNQSSTDKTDSEKQPLVIRRAHDLRINANRTLIGMQQKNVTLVTRKPPGQGRMIRWHPVQKGEVLSLKFATLQSTKGLALGLNMANSHGRFDIYLNHIQLAEAVNLYSPTVDRSKELWLPHIKLREGAHELLLVSAGKAGAAKGYALSLDFISFDLEPKRLASLD